MQIKHVQNFDVPVEYLFRRATDFERFESKTDTTDFSFGRVGRSPVGIGTRWNISVPYKGRTRKCTAELSQFVAPRIVSYRSTTRNYHAALSMTFTPVTETTSRLEFQLVAQSRSFATGLFFNTIRIARKRINRAIQKRMQQTADRIAADYSRQ